MRCFIIGVMIDEVPRLDIVVFGFFVFGFMVFGCWVEYVIEYVECFVVFDGVSVVWLIIDELVLFCLVIC